MDKRCKFATCVFGYPDYYCFTSLTEGISIVLHTRVRMGLRANQYLINRPIKSGLKGDRLFLKDWAAPYRKVQRF